MWWLGLVVALAGAVVTVWSIVASPDEAIVDATVLGIVVPYLTVSIVLIVVGVRAARGASRD